MDTKPEKTKIALSNDMHGEQLPDVALTTQGMAN